MRAAAEPLLTVQPPRAVVRPRRDGLVGAHIRAPRLLGEEHRGRHVTTGVVGDARHKSRCQLRIVAFQAARHRIHHSDGAAGDRLVRLQEHVQHRGHQRAWRVPGQASPSGAERCAHRPKPEHDVLQLFVRGMKVDLIDALAAPVVRTEHRGIAVRDSRQRFDPLGHQRAQFREGRFAERPRRLADRAPGEPAQMLVRRVPVAAIQRRDIPRTGIRDTHGCLTITIPSAGGIDQDAGTGDGHWPRSTSTWRSARSRSVMMPSTPRSSNSFMVASSLTVQTWMGSPERWAAFTKPAVTRLKSCHWMGTWTQSASSRAIRPASAKVHAIVTALRPIDVHTRRFVRARTRSRRRSEYEPMHTRSCASSRCSNAASGPTQTSSLGSMLTRTSGQRVSSSSSVGTWTPLPRNGNVAPPSAVNQYPASASRMLASGSLAMWPRLSVTRSRDASWNATSAPSEVMCTSVSRYRYPSATAASNAGMVFSGASSEPPRWANAIGPGWSRKGR